MKTLVVLLTLLISSVAFGGSDSEDKLRFIITNDPCERKVQIYQHVAIFRWFGFDLRRAERELEKLKQSGYHSERDIAWYQVAIETVYYTPIQWWDTEEERRHMLRLVFFDCHIETAGTRERLRQQALGE